MLKMYKKQTQLQFEGAGRRKNSKNLISLDRVFDKIYF